EVEREARAQGLKEVEVHAQVGTEAFYRGFGFVEMQGEERFWEEGIEHLKMRKVLE
ncbi:hypothetical protein HK097_009429, partial [Rhizophlyctis rosea]